MYPFQVPNSYLNPPFPYNLNYDFFRLHQLQSNSSQYPYDYQNFNFLHEKPNTSYLTSHQLPYFFTINQNHYSNEMPLLRKRKRITKKLTFIEFKKNIRSLHAEYKSKQKTFKYFDPSRAPPITSLRTNRELELDLRQEQQKTGVKSPQNDSVLINRSRSTAKLQILLKELNQKEYPFLICKKRKYHRNSKRRYSVAYFQQRASYIIKKEPIPPSLHPKNKVRKSRVLRNRNFQLSQSSQQSSDSQSEVFSSQYSNHKGENSESQEFAIKRENNKKKYYQNQIKAQVKSRQIFMEEF